MNSLKAMVAAVLTATVPGMHGHGARAADVGPIVADDWTGFYLGVFAGYGWGEARFDGSPYDDPPGLRPYTLDADGFFGGGHAGYNWQSGGLVAGVEAEAGYLGLDGHAVDPISAEQFDSDVNSSLDSDFFASLTGRLGADAGGWLIYGRGGVAFLNAETETIDNCSADPCGDFTTDIGDEKIHVGLAVGGGAERMLPGGWSVRGEYVYFDFGSHEISRTEPFENNQKVDVDAHTVKIGVSRQLHWVP